MRLSICKKTRFGIHKKSAIIELQHPNTLHKIDEPTFRTPEMQILEIFARFDPKTAPKTIILPIFCEKARTETKTSRCTAGFRTCGNLASMQVGESCQEMPVFCGQVGQEIQKSKILGCGMWDFGYT
jgi:hypothetical protein